MVSTVVETNNPEAELEAGLRLLGPIYEKYAASLQPENKVATDLPLRYYRFVTVTPIYSPASSGSYDNVYVTRSYDSTSHFE